MDEFFVAGHLADAIIRQYLAKELTQFNKQRAERHMLKCPLCYQRLEAMKVQMLAQEKHKKGHKKAA